MNDATQNTPEPSLLSRGVTLTAPQLLLFILKVKNVSASDFSKTALDKKKDYLSAFKVNGDFKASYYQSDTNGFNEEVAGKLAQLFEAPANTEKFWMHGGHNINSLYDLPKLNTDAFSGDLMLTQNNRIDHEDAVAVDTALKSVLGNNIGSAKRRYADHLGELSVNDRCHAPPIGNANGDKSYWRTVCAYPVERTPTR